MKHPSCFLPPAILAVLLASCSSPNGTKHPARLASLTAVGDLMFDRSVKTSIQKRGSGWAMENIRGEITPADISFANLESPISEISAMLEKPIGFRAPPSTAQLLADAGFDIVSLANNHAVDCGRDGLVETMGFLKKAGVRWCGAGKDRKSAEKAAVIRVKGVKIAFVAFCEFLEGSRKRNTVPTIALSEPGTVARVVAEARKKADVVVASFHWGQEYSEGPTRESRAIAKEAAEAGAALIIGHHPHVVQGLETIPRKRGRPALVAWSMGNFLFDQKKPETREGMFLHCMIGKDGVESARISPIRIEGFRPRPANAAERENTLSKVSALSATGLVGADGRLKLP